MDEACRHRGLHHRDQGELTWLAAPSRCRCCTSRLSPEDSSRIPRGERLGKVGDVIVRLDGDYPPVSGVLATVAGRAVFVPAAMIARIESGRVTLSAARLDLQHFERRPQEVLLKKDVLDRQLINVTGARLVRTNDIALARIEGWYRVVGVDTSLRGLMRRLLPRRLAERIAPGAFLDWASVEPFTGHVPTVRLRVPHPKLARLHPAQLADLVEAASHSEGEEILRAVAADGRLEASVYEELDAQHQAEFLDERTDQEVAGLLAQMESDDAVDLLGELEERRRAPVVELLPAVQRRRVRALVGYDPATAGGLMSPGFICLHLTATREEVLERVRRSKVDPGSLTSIYGMNPDRRLRMAIALADVVRAPEGSTLGDMEAGSAPRSLSVDTGVEEIARMMTDYDLTVAPVIDEHEAVVGVITVDDVLELMLPRGWRRRFDLLGAE